MRKIPAVAFVARYYCPEQRTTFGPWTLAKTDPPLLSKTGPASRSGSENAIREAAPWATRASAASAAGQSVSRTVLGDRAVTRGKSPGTPRRSLRWTFFDLLVWMYFVYFERHGLEVAAGGAAARGWPARMPGESIERGASVSS